MSTATLEQAGAQATVEQDGLLDQILSQTRAQDEVERDRNRTYIEQFISKVVQPGQVISKDVETNIKFWIAEIDRKLSAQLNEVMHAGDFQKLEGTWRGLHYLVQNTETSETLKIPSSSISMPIESESASSVMVLSVKPMK